MDKYRFINTINNGFVIPGLCYGYVVNEYLYITFDDKEEVLMLLYIRINTNDKYFYNEDVGRILLFGRSEGYTKFGIKHYKFSLPDIILPDNILPKFRKYIRFHREKILNSRK